MGPSSSLRGILQARTLEWVAFPFSGGSSQPRDHTWASWIAGKFFIVWATRETQKPNKKLRERQQCKKWTPWMKIEEHLGSETSRKPRDTGWVPREATQSRAELGFRKDSGIRGFVDLQQGRVLAVSWMVKNLHFMDFLGGPVAKSPCSQCTGPRFNSWLGN